MMGEKLGNFELKRTIEIESLHPKCGIEVG